VRGTPPAAALVPLILACLLLPAPAVGGGEPPDFQPIDQLLQVGKFAQAEDLARRILAGLESPGAGESMEAARALDLLAEAMRRGGKISDPETIESARRALAIWRMLLPPEDPRVVTSLNGVAVMHQERAEYAEARRLYEEIIPLRERAIPRDDVTLGIALHGYALVLQDLGELEESRRRYERAITLFESTPDPDEKSRHRLAASLNNLGNLLQSLGNLEKAETILERALAIRRELYGESHPDVATSLNNLAVTVDERGDAGRARDLYEQALAMRRKVLPPGHPRIASTLNNLGQLRMTLGDLDEARPLLEQALALRERALGPEHPLTSEVIGNLGTLAWKAGNRAAARAFYDRSTAILQASIGPDHPDIGRNLYNVARILEEEGDFDAARSAHERVLGLRVRALGEEHWEVAESLAGLASVAERTGDLPEARKLLDRALELRERQLGNDHPFVAETLRDRARLQWAAGETAAAFEDALRSERIAREQFQAAASVLSEREALRYEAIRVSGLDLAATLVADSRAQDLPDGSAQRFIDEVIRSRALVLDEMAARGRDRGPRDAAEITAARAALATAREHLARLVLRGPDPERPASEYLTRIRAVREAKEQAERNLAARSREFRGSLERGGAGLREARARIPSGAVLVSYLQFGRVTPPAKVPAPGAALTPSRVYLAILIRPGVGAPEMIPLGPADRIDALVRDWRREATADPTGQPHPARVETRYREAAARLREAIWDPVAARAGRVRSILVVPDGDLHLVAFATLPTKQGSYLLETGPTIHLLSAERDLAGSPVESPRNDGILLVGGPDYDAAPTPAPKSPDGMAGTGPRGGSARAHALRSAGSGCAEFRSLRFGPLPGARAEAEDLAALLRRGGGRSEADRSRVVELFGKQADEASFKRMAPQSRILHVATHGFFLQGVCVSSLDNARSEAREPRPAGGGDGSVLAGDNPLLLSGLALAGANRGVERGPGADGEDGILTAEEIASLDLSEVEWAVLSACDTGVGEVRSGEGVLGIRRAFEMAGTRTLILSLWPVEDRAAREWMRRLYTHRLGGHSTAESVRSAALDSLRSRRAKGRTTHPFFWGSFVAAGDWR
jgi:CHAT domain-containing protein/tetratricopeptide (TPR) repeat protein